MGERVTVEDVDVSVSRLVVLGLRVSVAGLVVAIITGALWAVVGAAIVGLGMGLLTVLVALGSQI